MRTQPAIRPRAGRSCPTKALRRGARHRGAGIREAQPNPRVRFRRGCQLVMKLSIENTFMREAERAGAETRSGISNEPMRDFWRGNRQRNPCSIATALGLWIKPRRGEERFCEQAAGPTPLPCPAASNAYCSNVEFQLEIVRRRAGTRVSPSRARTAPRMFFSASTARTGGGARASSAGRRPRVIGAVVPVAWMQRTLRVIHHLRDRATQRIDARRCDQMVSLPS